jgi:hypothetical protein
MEIDHIRHGTDRIFQSQDPVVDSNLWIQLLSCQSRWLSGSTESAKRVEATAHMICIYDTKRISEEIFEKIVVSMEIKQNSSSPSEFQSHATLIRYTLIRHAPVSDLVGEEGSRNNRASRQRQS